ncbi:hypothetical protein S83_041254 [Arachis hypogaea]
MLSHKLMNPSLSYIHTKKQYTSKTVRKRGLLVLGFLKRTSLTLNSQTHSLISHIATSRLASLSVSLESRLLHTRRRLVAGVETPAFQRLVVFHGLLVAGDRSNSSGLRRSSSSGFGSSSSLSRRGPWTVADFEITPWNSKDALKKGSGGWKKVVAAFGEEIFLENGEVNRPMLGQIVFSNPDKCQFLNRLWAPHISSGIFWEVVKLGLKGYKRKRLMGRDK